MAKRTAILGKDAPEHWWDELKMLRVKVAALWAANRLLVDKTAAYKERMEAMSREVGKLAGALKCTFNTCSPASREHGEQVLREAGWIP